MKQGEEKQPNNTPHKKRMTKKPYIYRVAFPM